MRFCPNCYSHNYRRSRRTLLERLLPFVRPRRCNDCRQRFYFGARPPFAGCPRCGTSELEIITRDRVKHNWKNALIKAVGGNAYRCPGCRLRFLDRRRHFKQTEHARKAAAS